MMLPPAYRKTLAALAAYLGAAALSLLLAAAVLKLFKADLTVPFAYTWDGNLVGAWIKGVMENGWYLRNGFIGAPHGMEMFDYPMADSLHFLLIKLIGLFASNYAVTLNLYFLLTFPLTAVCALFALRRFGVAYGPALVGGLLFAFLPYHFFRLAAGHLFLASYYLVPLMVMVALWVYLGPGLLFSPDEGGKVRLRFRGPRTAGGLVVCLLISCGGVYYAFFGCFLLVIAAAGAGLSLRRWYPLANAAALILTVCLGILANVTPTLLYRSRNGPNEAAVVRCPQGAEIHGLKIVPLLLPISNHRLRALADFRASYTFSPVPLAGENGGSTLGLAGSAGFLLLVGRLLYLRGPCGAFSRLLDGLCVLNLFAILLATIGGFGSYFSLVVTSWIRGYNRISVYISFLSLFAVVLALEGLRRRFVKGALTRGLFGVALGLTLVGGVLDQTSRDVVPAYARLKEEFDNDAEFVRRVEATLPPHALVFQLPFIPFPEEAPPHLMWDYDHFRGYLHSHTLRWSYGSFKGRGGSRWEREMARRPLPEMVEALTFAGFRGIYCDRFGYEKGTYALERELERLTGSRPLVSGNGRLVFFDLGGYGRFLRRFYTDAQWEARREAVLRLPPGSGLPPWQLACW
jgi:phosphoglycerol transferase